MCCVTEAAGGGGEARDTESKTRTPHKDVGNNKKHLRSLTVARVLVGRLDPDLR